jgi:hypothetical protein
MIDLIPKKGKRGQALGENEVPVPFLVSRGSHVHRHEETILLFDDLRETSGVAFPVFHGDPDVDHIILEPGR